MRCYAVPLALTALTAAPAQAADEDGQVWNTVTAIKPLSKRTEAQLDVSARYTEDASHLGQFLIRPMVTHRIGPTLSVSVAYIHSRNDRSDRSATHEHRALQQIQLRLFRTEGGLELTTRTRLEQRFLEEQGGVALRFRQQLRGQVPLGGKGVRANAFYEVLAEANGPAWGPKRGVEQLRAFAGLTLPIDRTLSADLGYLNMRQFRRGENRVNDIGWLQLTARF